VERYRKKLQRQRNQASTPSPNTKVRKILQGASVPTHIRKRLVFAEAVRRQLDDAVVKLETYKENQIYARFIGSRVLRKYRLMNGASSFIPRRIQKWCVRPVNKRMDTLREKRRRAVATLKTVTDFYNDDQNSECRQAKKSLSTKGVKKRSDI